MSHSKSASSPIPCCEPNEKQITGIHAPSYLSKDSDLSIDYWICALAIQKNFSFCQCPPLMLIAFWSKYAHHFAKLQADVLIAAARVAEFGLDRISCQSTDLPSPGSAAWPSLHPERHHCPHLRLHPPHSRIWPVEQMLHSVHCWSKFHLHLGWQEPMVKFTQIIASLCSL